jgi:anion transporter
MGVTQSKPVHGWEKHPLLRRLPRVELAKLGNEVVVIYADPNEEIAVTANGQHYILLIQSGTVGAFCENRGATVPLTFFRAGDSVSGTLIDQSTDADQCVFRATESVVAIRLPLSRFEELLTNHAGMLQDYYVKLQEHSAIIINELARAKSALVAHAVEIWAPDQVGVPVPGEAAVAIEAESEPLRLSPPARLVTWPWHRIAHYFFPVLVGLFAFFYDGEGFQFSPMRAGLAVLLWGVCTWLVDALPDYVVALAVVTITGCVGLVQSDLAFSGFSNRTWFLLLAVLGISAGISRTGLLYRVALYMLKLFPATYQGQAIALGLGGFALAPFLPGVTGRQVMASRLALELGEAMGFKPNSREMAGLAMACFVGFSCLYYISLTGGSVTLMVWSILPEEVRSELSWGRWFAVAAPIALLIFGALMVVVLHLYRPEQSVQIKVEAINSQLRILGPMSRQEWITAGAVLSVVVTFVTQPLHGIDPTWIALPSFLLLCSTGVIDRETLRRGIDWGFLLLTGGLLGIATVTSQSGFVKLAGNLVIPLVQPFADHPWAFYTVVAVITLVARLAIPFQPTILLASLALTPVAIQLHLNPFLTGLVILVMASHFLIPQNNPLYMAAFGGGEGKAFTHAQARPLALLHIVICLVCLWICIPLWQWLHLG